MLKSWMNRTFDADLVEVVKEYAESQCMTVFEVFAQFALKLKRLKEIDPTETILSDIDFTNSHLESTGRIKQGTIA